MEKRPKTGGRKKGVPNKINAVLKDAILLAGERAGNKIGKDGLVSYLEAQASLNPGPFMALLGKVLPTQLSGPNDGPIEILSKDQRDAAIAAAARADR